MTVRSNDHVAKKLLGVRALDKREYSMIIRDNICQFCMKTYVVTPHLVKTVQMRVTTYDFKQKYSSIIINYHLYLQLLGTRRLKGRFLS